MTTLWAVGALVVMLAVACYAVYRLGRSSARWQQAQKDTTDAEAKGAVMAENRTEDETGRRLDDGTF